MERPIAVFDSGVGGLTVVREMIRLSPTESIVYFGDTARAPYGPLKEEEIQQYCLQSCLFLEKFDPSHIVLACNTATAVMLDELQHKGFNVSGVIQPGIEKALNISPRGKIGVIATEATVRSRAYESAIQNRSPEVKVLSKACPTLVPLVESGLWEGEKAEGIVEAELTQLLERGIDTLILGCTHYPFLQKLIEKITGPDIQIVNSALATAQAVKALLPIQLAKSDYRPMKPSYMFYSSGVAENFQKLAVNWFKQELPLDVVRWEQVDPVNMHN